MSATLKLTHKAIGAEVRRGTYDVVVDGERVGSVEMNDTIEIPVEPGRHTLQACAGRKSSSTETFDAPEGEIVAFRCTGKRFLPIFLASFIVPRLALKLVRDRVGVAVVALTSTSSSPPGSPEWACHLTGRWHTSARAEQPPCRPIIASTSDLPLGIRFAC